MGDLFGSKRPSRLRSVRTWSAIALILTFSLIVAYILYSRVSSYDHPSGDVVAAPLQVDSTSPEKGLHFGKASLQYRGSLGIVHTWGGMFQIGAQYGRLLAEQARTINLSVHPSVHQSVKQDGLLGPRLHNIRLRWRWRNLDDGIAGHQLVELAGLVRGASQSDVKLDYEDMVRQSAVLDVGVPAEKSSGASIRTMARALTMMVPMTSDMGNRLLVARSFALPGLADGGTAVRDHPVLHISHPTEGLATASLGWPGLTGIVSGMNSERVAVFVHFAKTSDVRLSRVAQPSALLAKDMLENAHSLSEAVNILKHAKTLGTAIYVIVDGNERRWAVVERSPTKFDVIEGTRAKAVVDSLQSKKLKEDSIVDRTRRTRPILQRLQRAQKLLKRRHNSLAEVVELLRDRSAPDGNTLVFGHRGALDDPESVQVALFDVSSMVVWVAGDADSKGLYRAIDLRHALSGAEGVGAPPPNIPAEPGDEELSTVRQARILLRSATNAQVNGATRRARELADAALARTPTLPEALLVAGRLAREDGDELSARALLQGFLAAEADDLKAAEQVRAWLDGHSK